MKDGCIYCIGCSGMLLALILIGSGIYNVVQYNRFIDATLTECRYESTEIADCIGYKTVGKHSTSCNGKQAKYYYDVNNDTPICDKVFYQSSCSCYAVDEEGFEDPLKNDGEWYACYIDDCKNDGFTFGNPNSFKKSYIILFIIGSILFVIGFIWTLQMCYDYKSYFKKLKKTSKRDAKQEPKHHKIGTTNVEMV